MWFKKSKVKKVPTRLPTCDFDQNKRQKKIFPQFDENSFDFARLAQKMSKSKGKKASKGQNNLSSAKSLDRSELELDPTISTSTADLNTGEMYIESCWDSMMNSPALAESILHITKVQLLEEVLKFESEEDFDLVIKGIEHFQLETERGSLDWIKGQIPDCSRDLKSILDIDNTIEREMELWKLMLSKSSASKQSNHSPADTTMQRNEVLQPNDTNSSQSVQQLLQQYQGQNKKKGIVETDVIDEMDRNNVCFLSKLRNSIFCSAKECFAKNHHSVDFAVYRNRIFSLLKNDQLYENFKPLLKQFQSSHLDTLITSLNSPFNSGKLYIQFVNTLTYPRPAKHFKVLMLPSTTISYVRDLIRGEVSIEDERNIQLILRGKVIPHSKNEETLASLGVKSNQKIIISRVLPCNPSGDVASGNRVQATFNMLSNRQAVGELLFGKSTTTHEEPQPSDISFLTAHRISQGYQIIGRSLERIAFSRGLRALAKDLTARRAELELYLMLESEEGNKITSKKKKNAKTKAMPPTPVQKAEEVAHETNEKDEDDADVIKPQNDKTVEKEEIFSVKSTSALSSGNELMRLTADGSVPAPSVTSGYDMGDIVTWNTPGKPMKTTPIAIVLRTYRSKSEEQIWVSMMSLLQGEKRDPFKWCVVPGKAPIAKPIGNISKVDAAKSSAILQSLGPAVIESLRQMVSTSALDQTGSSMSSNQSLPSKHSPAAKAQALQKTHLEEASKNSKGGNQNVKQTSISKEHEFPISESTKAHAVTKKIDVRIAGAPPVPINQPVVSSMASNNVTDVKRNEEYMEVTKNKRDKKQEQTEAARQQRLKEAQELLLQQQEAVRQRSSAAQEARKTELSAKQQRKKDFVTPVTKEIDVPIKATNPGPSQSEFSRHAITPIPVEVPSSLASSDDNLLEMSLPETARSLYNSSTTEALQLESVDSIYDISMTLGGAGPLSEFPETCRNVDTGVTSLTGSHNLSTNVSGLNSGLFMSSPDPGFSLPISLATPIHSPSLLSPIVQVPLQVGSLPAPPGLGVKPTINFCPFCGNKLQQGHRFCGNCGERIPGAELPVPMPSTLHSSMQIAGQIMPLQPTSLLSISGLGGLVPNTPATGTRTSFLSAPPQSPSTPDIDNISGSLGVAAPPLNSNSWNTYLPQPEVTLADHANLILPPAAMWSVSQNVNSFLNSSDFDTPLNELMDDLQVMSHGKLTR